MVSLYGTVSFFLLTIEFSLVQTLLASFSAHQGRVLRKTQQPEFLQRAAPVAKVWTRDGTKKVDSLTEDGATKESFHWCFLQPVRRLPGVGETEDGAELHVKDEVKDEQWLFVQCAWDVIFLKTKTKPQDWQDLLVSPNPVSLPDTCWSALTVRPSGKSKRSWLRAGVVAALPLTELKSLGWWRPSCCSFSGFCVSVAENSSFCSGIWGGDRLNTHARVVACLAVSASL